MQAVKDVFPNSEVQPVGTNNYPIKVIVTAKNGSQNTKIWSGRQQDLFRKYASKRTKAIVEIKRNLTEYKKDVCG